MKKNTLVLPLCAVIGTALALAGHSLVGSWKAAYGDGITGKMVVRSNGTFLATFDQRTFKVGGRYKFDGNTLSIADSSCGLRYWAKYGVDWLTDDSIRITVIEDTCAGRRGDGNGAVLVRAKR